MSCRRERDPAPHKKETKMTDKMKIMVPFGVVTQMERDGFGSRPTIRKALRGDYNEWNEDERKRALRIRKRALQVGGVAVPTATEA